MSYANAGSADFHVAALLHHYWKTHYTTYSKFQKLFVGVEDTVLQRWHDALAAAKDKDGNARELQIRLHGTKGPPSFPGVVVQLTGERLVEWPLGTHQKIGDELVHVMIVDQDVTVEIRTPSPETTRALAVVARAALWAGRDFLCKSCGYLDLSYRGGGGLSPEEQFVAEQAGMAGVVVWRQEWTARLPVSVPELEEVPLSVDWYLWAADVKDVDGRAGGVLAYQP